MAALALGITGVVVNAGSAAASCASLPTGDAAAIAAAPVAFVGTVAFTANGGRTAYFTVDEVWRGPDLAWMTVVHGGPLDDPNSMTSVDRTWMNGTRYLVLPYADARGELRDDACSATAPYQASLDALRPANARPAVPLLPGALIVLAAAIALILWQAVRRRADERRPA